MVYNKKGGGKISGLSDQTKIGFQNNSERPKVLFHIKETFWFVHNRFGK